MPRCLQHSQFIPSQFKPVLILHRDHPGRRPGIPPFQAPAALKIFLKKAMAEAFLILLGERAVAVRFVKSSHIYLPELIIA